MAWDSSVLLFAVVLCGGLMAAASASTVAGQGSSIASFSHAAVAAVVVGGFAVYLARTRSADKRGFSKETVLRKTAQYEIITGDRAALEAKIEKMRLGGSEQLVVVSDFDMTLTSFLMPDGSRGMSTHGILERSGYFGEAFTARAKQIFNKYYPIEVDPNIDPATKWAAMSEWWETTHALMVAEGLTKSDIRSCVSQGHFAFRDGVQELLDKLTEKKVPVMIFSAGIADVLEEIFRQRLGLENVNIVSNRMKFDSKGKLIGFQDKTIHIMIKGAVALKGTPNYEKVRGRKNIILLGDSPGDLRMADGLDDAETVLRIGFLNDKLEERRQEYLGLFDVVLVNDGPMSAFHDLLAPILQ
jgi:5'-nucleotidase